ncbi:iron chelate uptake ABC transporter family permease subunit [Nocardioides endophyticus]|uniref:Iron chelate uptake ABC transporter family permease subunit n=2 Tax=Nocardioides endophyticus TaxID=1353775 RepID=A0ABP8Z2B3_9ACTN
MTGRACTPGAVLVAMLLLAASMAVALGIGPVSVSVGDVLAVVARRLNLGAYDVSPLDDQIVWQLRLPRVLGAAAVGAGLAVCGVVLQSLTRNDLADPYLLGISSGAAVGAVTVIVLGVSFAGLVGSAAVTAAGFVGALGSLVVVLALAAGRRGSLSPTRTVLAGVAVAQVCGAYTSLLVIMTGDSDAARRVLTWTLGSVAGLRWSSAVIVSVVAIVATAAFVAFADQLDAFAFGETSARSLGVDVNRVRWALMVGTALVTACLVAFVGAIGFVGLVVPHIVRILTGPGHRVLLPMSALVGAVLLVWADTIARTLVDGQEIPIGVVTAVVGAPFFAWLLRRTRERS